MKNLQNANRLSGWALAGAAVSFWTGWVLMPGVGITDAARILALVGAHSQRVLASSVLQLLSAALLGLAIPGLAHRFAVPGNASGGPGVAFLAVGACGVAADAVYHQLAYEMARPGVDQAAMLPVMQRMQNTDLLFVLPMILAFLFGCAALSMSAAQMRIVARWNPMLYAVSVGVAVAGGRLGSSLGMSGRAIGLTCLGLLSTSLGWVGIALARSPSARDGSKPSGRLGGL